MLLQNWQHTKQARLKPMTQRTTMNPALLCTMLMQNTAGRDSGTLTTNCQKWLSQRALVIDLDRLPPQLTVNVWCAGTKAVQTTCIHIAAALFTW